MRHLRYVKVEIEWSLSDHRILASKSLTVKSHKFNCKMRRFSGKGTVILQLN